MFQLHFNNQIFRRKEDFKLENKSIPDFVEAAFTFCKAWLSGQEIFLQQTSGSTGTPKETELTRAQMLASARATGAFFRTNSETRLLCCLNSAYIAGKMMLVRAMLWDCPIWLVEPKSNPFQDLPKDFSPDFIAMVPLQVETCLEDFQTLVKLKKVSILIIGGAPVSQNLKTHLLENNIPAWQTYGMTETVSHIALAKIESGDSHYHTLPGVEIGQDVLGALWVKSPMSGSEKIQTNDLVKLTSKTSFHWQGRADFVINSGGVKLHPELLEQKSESLIREFFPESRFFYHGEKDEKLGERLVLILEKAKPDKELAKLLQEKIKSELGNFETPKKIYFLPSFIETESGKIDRLVTFQQL
jgi:O-succinylbenzoic acid--CoA ligase